MEPNINNAPESTPAPHIVVEQIDLVTGAAAEIEREKWYQGEQAGYDKGDVVTEGWKSTHWPGFVRERLFEHLHGRRYWTDFGRDDFGLLNRAFQDDQVLLDCIVDRFRAGQENLDVLNWAYDFNMPSERVHEILLAININRCRMGCPL